MKTVFIVFSTLLILESLFWFMPLFVDSWICGNMPGSMCWGNGWQGSLWNVLVLGAPIVVLGFLASGIIMIARKFAKKGLGN